MTIAWKTSLSPASSCSKRAMANKDLLSQDEIDALLASVDKESSDQTQAAAGKPGMGDVRAVDFSNQERFFRGPTPMLDMINERFCRSFNHKLANTVRRPVQISCVGTRPLTYSDFLHTLALPTSINFIQIKPLAGTALAVFGADLIFVLVHHFFGGGGKMQVREGREDFTPTENRVVSKVLEQVFIDMKEAWMCLMPMELHYLRTETNPDFAHALGPTELMLVSSFEIDIEGQGGKFQLALPSAMLEPVRDRLSTTFHGEKAEASTAWQHVLKSKINAVNVDLTARLAEIHLSLRQLLDMEPGDIIPLELPEQATLYCNNIPLFVGQFGASGGRNAIKITGRATSDPTD